METRSALMEWQRRHGSLSVTRFDYVSCRIFFIHAPSKIFLKPRIRSSGDLREHYSGDKVFNCGLEARMAPHHALQYGRSMKVVCRSSRDTPQSDCGATAGAALSLEELWVWPRKHRWWRKSRTLILECTVKSPSKKGLSSPKTTCSTPS